ncbi:zinc finger, CCHC-type containing protein [Tanacetum coccineum]
MVAAAMKHVASNFAKINKFEWVDFRRWQKKMHFLLSSMSVVYMLTTHIPDDGGDNLTVEQVRKRAKWDNDDYVCKGLILNGMSNPLFNIYQNVESSKELWDSFKAKYMAEDASSKKFLVSNFTNYKMTDLRPVLEQYNELLGILRRFTQHKMNMDEAIQLGSHLRIEESPKVQDSDKPKRNNVAGPLVVNMVKHNNSSRYNDNKGKRKHHYNTRVDHNKKAKPTCWKCGKSGHTKKDFKGVNVGNKANGSGTKGLADGSSNSLKGQNMFNKYLQSVGIIYETTAPYTPQQNGISKRKNRVLKEIVSSMLSYSRLGQGFWGEAMAVVRLLDPKLKTLGKRGIKCIFVGYAEHSKAFRFYVIEPNDSVSINLIIESRDAIFDENILSLVPRPNLRIPNGTKDIGGSVVPEEVTKEVVQQPKPELRKSKRNRTLKNFGPKFQLYLIKGTRDEVSDQHSYCFNVEDDPKTYDEAVKSQDAAFLKEAINDEMDSIMGNNTWVLADLPPGCKPLGFKWIYKRKLKVDGTIEKFKARLVIQGYKQKLGKKYFDMDDPDMGEVDVILGIRVKHESNRIVISQSHYIEKVLKKFNYFECTPVCTPIDTSEKLMPNNGKLSRYTSNPGTQHWQAIQRVTLMQAESATLKTILLQVTGAAGKEAEWLKNFLFKISLWSKPIAHISIRCDSAATLAKAYSRMYNEKYRHLGARHCMIHKLVTKGVVSIEFMRSQQNLADHLMKGLARDLVLNTCIYISSQRCAWNLLIKEDEVVNFSMVTEHPDSDNGNWEFMSLMMFNELLFSKDECNSRLNDIDQSDGFSLVLLEE